MPHKQEFDTAYMEALFNYGFQRSVKGYVWDQQPPGLKNALDLDVENNTELNTKFHKDKVRNSKKANNSKSAQLN